MGGFVGSIAAAILTQKYEPRWCFLFSSFMGLGVAIQATRLNVSLENEGRVAGHGKHGMWHDMKRNFAEIGEVMKVKEFTSLICYLLIGGFIVPSFGSFGYYFLLDVVKISKFTYSMLTVVGFFCLFAGTQVFRKFFGGYEYRNLIAWTLLLFFAYSLDVLVKFLYFRCDCQGEGWSENLI